jgi:putative chitinase
MTSLVAPPLEQHLTEHQVLQRRKSIMVTESQLAQIMPNLPADKRALYLPFLNKAMQIYGINNPLREAAFIAQIAYESVELRYLEEIWGPTEAQSLYEPESAVARILGNTEPGDGERFKGRGAIQITGRSNYGKYGELLGVDLIANPAIVTTPQIALSTAGAFWQMNGLNELADAGDFEAITRRINGGLSGYKERLEYYRGALEALGRD